MKLINIQNDITPEFALENIVDATNKSFSGMVSSIANYFPDLRNKLEATLQLIKSDPIWPRISSSLVNSALSNFSSKDSMSVTDFNAFNQVVIKVPESFSGNLNDYAEFLDRSWKFLQTTALPQLDNYYAMLASFATNKESKISLVDVSKTYAETEAQYISLVKESQSYFGKVKHNSSSAKLGDCFTDFDQFKHASTITKELSKSLDRDQFRKVHDKIKRITSVLDIIIEDATKGAYEKASYESVKSLANGVYTLANVIEFFPVTVYRIHDLTNAMVNNKAIVSKLK